MTCKNMHGGDFTLESALSGVGKGWHRLVTNLYELCDKNNVVIYQVKEKWGGLRFYTGDAPMFVLDAIEAAEKISVQTCENCGEPGRQRGGGWIVTLCDKCAEPNEEFSEEPV